MILLKYKSRIEAFNSLKVYESYFDGIKSFHLVLNDCMVNSFKIRYFEEEREIVPAYNKLYNAILSYQGGVIDLNELGFYWEDKNEREVKCKGRYRLINIEDNHISIW